MLEHQIFIQITMIFIVAALVVYIFNLIKIPSIVGLLFSGIIMGPSLLSIISDSNAVSFLAEMGVILLLFMIGLEFSIERLKKVKYYVILGGIFQLTITSILFTLLMKYALGFDFNVSFFLGLTASLSSTALVMKFLQESAQIYSPHGNASVGILIFQDIAVVFIIMFIPLLMSSNIEGNYLDFGVTFLKTSAIIAILFVSAKKIVPWILYKFLKLNNREIFIVSTIALCFVFSLILEKLGFSLALGAFMAGVVMSESEYSHYVFDNISPFKDVFLSLFFISVGLLIDIKVLFYNIHYIFFLSLVVIFLKTLASYFSLKMMKTPSVVSLKSALCINQVGEFSFVLMNTAFALKLIQKNDFQIGVSVIIVTIIISSFILKYLNPISDFFLDLFKIQKIENNAPSSEFNNHVIIIGFGINGRNLAKSLKFFDIPYTVIELNPKTVKTNIATGENIFFGDASSKNTLEQAGLNSAKIVVIAISDPNATRKISRAVKNFNENVKVVSRGRYYTEVEILKNEGSDFVVSEEYEASMEIISVVLDNYNIPNSVAHDFLKELRQSGYKSFRDLDFHNEDFETIKKAGMGSFVVGEGSAVVNKKLSETNIRSFYNLLVVGIRRGNDVFVSPGGDFVLNPNDEVFLFGEYQKINLYIKEINQN